MGDAALKRDELVERARSADILDTALRLGAELKRSGSEHVGPCPAGCSSHDGFAVNTRRKVFVCRRGAGGGDVIALVQHCKGLDFHGAVAWLTGEEMQKSVPMPLSRSALHERHGVRKKAPADDDRDYRAAEVEKARGIWERGTAIFGTAAEAYLLARGISLDALSRGALLEGERLPGLPLRFAEDLPYWHDGKSDYRGPAMLAAVTDAGGALVGVHITWIAAAKPGDKATLTDPETGEPLPAKKLRGTKRHGAIRLVDPDDARRLVLGEGIETVLSVWAAELGHQAGTAYWSAIDLSHLAGKAAGQVPHPTLFMPQAPTASLHEEPGDPKRGRARKPRPLRVGNHIPEAQPDRDLVVPDAIAEIVLLGDGDSDPFTTEMALRRAAARFACPGGLSREALHEPAGGPPVQRIVKVAWAPAGQDFNDLLRASA